MTTSRPYGTFSVPIKDVIAAARLRLSSAIAAAATAETKRERKHWMGVVRRERRCIRDLTGRP